MRRIGRAALALGMVAFGIAGCSRGGDLGPAGTRRLLLVDHSTVTTTTGVGVMVSATLRDANGSITPVTDLRWTSRDTTVAVVLPDTAPIPGDFVARATILGRSRVGGWTMVVVTAARLTDTVRVAVLPAKLDASLIAYAGTAHADTVVRAAQFGPPPVPAIATAFSAPDTLIINGTAALHFDTTSSYGYYGPAYVRTAAGRATGYVASKTPTQLKVVFVVGAAGPLVVRNLRLVTGDSTFGTLGIDSLVCDSVAVSRQRFTGTVAMVGDTMTVTAAPGTSIVGSGNLYYSPLVSLDTTTAAVMSQTATQLRVLSPVSLTGVVTVRGVVVSGAGGSTVTLDSLKTNGSYTIAAATFPGAIVTGGRLLDTVIVRAAGGASPYTQSVTVPATYPCAGCSYAAWTVYCCVDSARFIPPVGVNGPILLGAVRVGSASLPMYTRTPLVVSGTTTGEPNEPGNDSAAGATVLPVGSRYTFGALNGSTDTTDYYTFQVPVPAYVALADFNYPGTGTGDASNPRIYAFVCDSLVSGVCGSAIDLAKGMVLLPPGQAWLRVTMRTPTAGYVAYRMSLSEFPVEGARAQPGHR